MNVYSGFIHNCTKQETTQMSSNWWVDKSAVVHLYDGLFNSSKKEQIIGTHNNWVESQVYRAKEAKFKMLWLHSYDIKETVKLEKKTKW